MNEALREHVTRTGFNLTLGKSHIAALVMIVEHWQKDESWTSYGAPWSHFWTGFQGLKTRGLAWHQYHDTRPPNPYKPPSAFYGLTTAGQYMVGLLSESGIWQDYLHLLELHKEAGYVRFFPEKERLAAHGRSIK